MNSHNRFLAEVPIGLRKQDIRWLILEEDSEHTGGWFLYGHRDLDEGSQFDSWHLSREEAEREAETEWGVQTEAWKANEG